MVRVVINQKKVFFKADELKTAIHPDSERGLYCQQLNKQDFNPQISQITLMVWWRLRNLPDISASALEKVNTFS
jgi:hypothetical protein